MALTWGDIKATDAGLPYLDITKAAKNDRRIGTTKNGKSRFAYLTEFTFKALHQWRTFAADTADNDLMFPNRDGGVIQRGVVADCLDRVLAAHSISSPEGRITPHSFRHTFNTIIRPHMDDKILQQFTGHQSTAMTDYYDHTTTEARANQLAPHAATLSMVWRQLYKPKTDGDEQEIGQEVTA